MTQPDSLALVAQANAANPQLELAADDAGVTVQLLAPRLAYYHSFIRGPLVRRAQQPEQALLRACRGRQRNIASVLDLTAGWGADALTLAWHGREVRLFEQNAAVYAVIAHSFACLANSARHAQIAQRLHIQHLNAFDWLQTSTDEYDCIYIDPMFPLHKSGAKSGKSSQILQALTGNLELDACFELARARAGKRVVVKRPAKARCLGGIQADLVYREKSVRFDVYLID